MPIHASHAPRAVSLLLAALAAACASGQDTSVPAAGGAVNQGYGSRDAEDVTGAVSSVTAAQLGERQSATLEQALRGRIPGLQIVHRGGEVTFYIRGLRGGREPHVVIDGVPSTARHLLRMTPDVIARIDVLKDAAASVYGLRGANGVIVVATKRGTP